jgi:hypothetical protein
MRFRNFFTNYLTCCRSDHLVESQQNCDTLATAAWTVIHNSNFLQTTAQYLVTLEMGVQQRKWGISVYTPLFSFSNYT